MTLADEEFIRQVQGIDCKSGFGIDVTCAALPQLLLGNLLAQFAAFQPTTLHEFDPLLATVLLPILTGKGFLLGVVFLGESLIPLSVLEDDLIAAFENLERRRHLIHLVELYRVRLAKNFEERREHEVAQGNVVDVEAECLDRIGALVGVKGALVWTRIGAMRSGVAA